MSYVMRRYKAKRTGIFRSRLEKRVASALEGAGVDYSYESQKLKYLRPQTYTPDFVLPNGIMLEVKGYFEGSDRTKHLLVREQNPDADVRFVFQNANTTLNKNSKTTYGQWCDDNGFEWCDAKSKIPNEWINLPPP